MSSQHELIVFPEISIISLGSIGGSWTKGNQKESKNKYKQPPGRLWQTIIPGDVSQSWIRIPHDLVSEYKLLRWYVL